MVVSLAAGSGSRRLARLSGCQFGVAQCLKAALAATATWDNLACSGLRRVAQLCCSHSGVIHRRKMAQTTTLVCCHDGGSYVRVQCNELLSTGGARFGSLMEIWETGCKDRWTKRGGELGLFQFLKHNKATLTYAMLVRHQFTNRITKLPSQPKREITRSKA